MIAQVDSSYIKTRPLKLATRLISYFLFEGRPVTTRGQWINPLVFAHLKLWKVMPQIRKVKKPIFILGAGRSGTTILGVLLSMHRSVGFLNEPKAMWHTIHPHEDVGGGYNTSNTVFYRLNAENSSTMMKKTANRLYSGYLAETFSRRVVDKYPELSFRVPFVKALFPDAKFIFLVRNGWETCASIEKWSARHAHTKETVVHDWWGVNQRKWHLLIEHIIEPDPYFKPIINEIRNYNRQVDMAAVEWIATMREGLRLAEERKDIYLIKYEDLVHKPKETLNKLLTFCELSHDEKFMTYAEKKLRPAKPHEALELHPAILPLFRETLEQLDYE